MKQDAPAGFQVRELAFPLRPQVPGYPSSLNGRSAICEPLKYGWKAALVLCLRSWKLVSGAEVVETAGSAPVFAGLARLAVFGACETPVQRALASPVMPFERYWV